MRIITISGLDGSGKSTQIEMLKNYLAGQNKKVFYFHAVQFSIANKILKSRGEASTETRSVIKSGWLKIQLRRIALIIDLLRLRLLLNKLQKSGYDYVLSDRYFFDTIVNILYLNQKSGAKLLDEELSSLKIIKPDLAIYLSAEPGMIMQRECQPDQGIEYLVAKKEIFDKKYAAWGLKFIDGNRDKETIFEELKKLVDSL
jgi:thymidylate kinase